MTITLKPCPFCGGKAEIRHVQPVRSMKSGKYLGFFVLCTHCLTSSNNYATEAQAAEAWNRRTVLD